jgi:hypothetical protein
MDNTKNSEAVLPPYLTRIVSFSPCSRYVFILPIHLFAVDSKEAGTTKGPIAFAAKQKGLDKT